MKTLQIQDMAGKKRDPFLPPVPLTNEEVENFVKRDCVKAIQIIGGLLDRVARVADARRVKLDTRMRMMEHGANLSKSYAALTRDVLDYVQEKDKMKAKVPEITRPKMFEEAQEDVHTAINGMGKVPPGLVE